MVNKKSRVLKYLLYIFGLLLVISLFLPYFTFSGLQDSIMNLGLVVFGFIVGPYIGFFLILISIINVNSTKARRAHKIGIIGSVILICFLIILILTIYMIEGTEMAIGTYFGFLSGFAILIINGALLKRTSLNIGIIETPTIRKSEEQILGTLRNMMEVSTKIKLDRMQSALKMEDHIFNEKIFNWARDFGFTIDGDYLIVNKNTVNDFMDALDKQFKEWKDLERQGQSKIY